MNKTMSFIRLDFFTVKPYFTWRNLSIYIIVALIMAFSSKTPYASIGMLMVFASLYVTVPFSVSEKNSIDALYVTLAIKRKDVVAGRYIFALFVNLFAGILAWFFSMLAMTITKAPMYDNDIKTAFATVVVMFIIINVIQAVQLPIFFKLGYSKAKFLSYLPFFSLAALSGFILTFFNNDNFNFSGIIVWVESNMIIAVLILIAAWLLIMFVSYKISLAYYNKRDF